MSTGKGLPATLVMLSLYLFFILLLEMGQGGLSRWRDGLIFGATLAFLAFLLYQMLRTGQVNRWRKIFFTTYAVMFVIQFVWWSMGDRGHRWLLGDPAEGAWSCWVATDLAALRNYAECEHRLDAAAFPTARAFFLPAAGRQSNGRLAPVQVNRVWDAACTAAAVAGKRPPSARHARGRRPTAARPPHAVYSLQYSRVTEQELRDTLEGTETAQ